MQQLTQDFIHFNNCMNVINCNANNYTIPCMETEGLTCLAAILGQFLDVDVRFFN